MKWALSIALILAAVWGTNQPSYPVKVTVCNEGKRADGFTVIQNYTNRLYVFGKDCSVDHVIELGPYPANHVIVSGREYWGVGGKGFFHVKGGQFVTQGAEVGIRHLLGARVFLHHDSLVLPSGNYLSIAYVKRHNGAGDDVLVEFTAAGTVVRQRSLSEIVLGRNDAALSLPVGDSAENWLHTNSLALGPDGLVVGVRNLSSILVLDWETGSVLRTFGPDVVSMPHDIEWNGELLAYTAFDNGVASGRSSIAIIERNGTLRKRIPLPFFAFAYGSVELLENGNWLVLDGMNAEVYEFTESGEIVAQFQLAERHPIPFLRDAYGNPRREIIAYRAYHTDTPMNQNWPSTIHP